MVSLLSKSSESVVNMHNNDCVICSCEDSKRARHNTHNTYRPLPSTFYTVEYVQITDLTTNTIMVFNICYSFTLECTFL